MPLSRLSPRRASNKLARQKATSSQHSDSQRHLHLWSAIRKTREELDQWQRQTDQVESLFGSHIAPREKKLTSATSKVTEQLIEHFSSRQLEIPDQSLLGLWVTDNLTALHDHPFGDTAQIRQLCKRWLKALNYDGPVENQLAQLARKHNFTGNNPLADSEESHNNDAIVDVDAINAEPAVNQHDQSDNTADKVHAHSTDEEGDETADGSRDNGARDCSTSTTAETVDSLEQKLSVERLFRQLAKVLHPDREQDEDLKAAKHILMSECLKARQEKDINALLSLYCEHVGELPDDLNNNSHQELISALEKQLKELQMELRHKRFGDPLHTLIVERYSASTTAECELRINNHSQSLDSEICAVQKLTEQLVDKEGLLDALDERRAVEQDRMAIDELTGY